MIINVSYDSSVSGAPSGFTTAVQAAVDFYEHAFDDPITLNIDFGYGEVDGHALGSNSLGQSTFTNGNSFTYAQTRTALFNDATGADDATANSTLPASDPTGGGSFLLTKGEQKALGLFSATGTEVDGFVGLSNTHSFTFDPNDRAVPGDYDAIGVFEHEISEVMGRYESLGQHFGNNVYTPLDLFRYSSPGVRDLAYGDGYFSIDGSNLLMQFNNPNNGGDAADWFPHIQGDSYGSGSQDLAGLVSPTDLRLMDVIGYDRAPATTYDVNGDAASDVLLQNDNGTLAAWEVNGSHVTATPSIGNPGPTWHVAGIGDFNGDRIDDLLFQNDNGTLGIWELNGGQITGAPGLGNPGTSWHVAGIGDFNNDGTSDILFKNDNGTLAIWELSNGQPIATPGLGNPGSTWHEVGIGDFNGDGTSDILFQNDNGTLGLWELNGGQVIAAPGLGNPGPGWHVAGVGDFNADGKADILFQNDNGTLAVWETNGTSVIATPGLGNPGPGWHVAAVGDYNADGTSDILLHNDDGSNLLWIVNNGVVVATSSLGNPGTTWHVLANPHEVV